MSSSRNKLLTIIRELALERGEFTLASGQKSDYYLDMRRVSMNERGLEVLADAVDETIDDLYDLEGEPSFNAVGGMATGVVPLVAALIFEYLPVQGFYCRQEKKEHGTQQKLEGLPKDYDYPSMRAIVLEDVTTTGQSALDVCDEVQRLGGSVVSIISVIDRDAGAAELFKLRDIPYHYLYSKYEVLAQPATTIPPRKGAEDDSE